MSARLDTATEARPRPTGTPGREALVRRSALLLHALRPADRAWVLDRLGHAERLELEPLLAELAALGIPADRGLVAKALVTREDAIASGGEPPGAPDALAALRRADPTRLEAALRGEPARLVARVLRLSDWPWERALLRRLDPQRRRQVERELTALPADEAGAGAALRRQLAATLGARLAARGALAAGPSPRTGALALAVRLARRGGRA